MLNRIVKAWWVLMTLVAVFTIPVALTAQETTGGMNGYVKDKSGAAVAKAQVEVTSPALITSRKLNTDNAGYFYFQQLPPGDYALTITAPNFRTFKQTGIKLGVGKLPTFDVALEVGAVSETVEVSGQTPIVDVTTSKVAVDIPQDVIDNLPKGRSYQSLIPFAPGARQEPLQSSRTDRLRQNGFQIDGASDSENTYLVEGLDTSNIQNGGVKQNVIFEFVDQVQIKTSGTEAEFGGAMGGVVNVVQKRGSNDWHGGFVAYYKADALDANDQCATTPQPSISDSWLPSGTQIACGQRYNPAAAKVNNGTRTDQGVDYYMQKKDQYRTVEGGYEIGGPLFKNKLWLFSSYIPTVDRIQRSVLFNGSTSPGVHSFTRSDTVHNMLNRLDYQPFSKLHLFAGWQYGYHRVVGQLPTLPDSLLPGQANPISTNDPAIFRPDTGSVNPSNILNFGGDYTLNSRTIVSVRYGYFYYNSEDRGLPNGVRYLYQNDLVPDDGNPDPKKDKGTTSPVTGAFLLPAGSTSPLIHFAGFSNISANLTSLFDVFSRKAFNADVSHSVSKWGTHNFKAGYGFNHLYNNVFQGINSARINVFYGQKYTASTPAGNTVCDSIKAANVAAGGANFCAGTAGYFTIMDGITTIGQAASYNHGIYGQDSWNVGHGLTLNLGVRFDKEYLPPYSAGNPSISFGFTQKAAPRIGGAYDLLHNGKLKLFASYGKFFDIMKYSLPRGSFGGEYWHDCVYAMSFLDASTIQPTSPGNHACGPTQAPSAGVTVGQFIENINWRAPAGDPTDPGVDPNLSPMSQHESIVGIDWAITSKMGLEVRYARKRLDNAIDDQSIDDSQYYIGNPGPNTYSNLLHRPLPADGFNTAICPTCPNAPPAIRNYDGIESRLTYRGSKMFGQFTYTYSRLRGNYSGLTDTDITDANGGRHNANNNRSFDLPEMQYTTTGQIVDGPLATDRPNVATINGYYPLHWLGMETTLGVIQTFAQGSPKSTCVPVVDSTSSCQFWGQRGTWANISRDPATGNLVLGSVETGARMPWLTQTDLNLGHSFRVSKTNEAMRLGFEANVENIFNQHAVLSYNPNPFAQGNEFLGFKDSSPLGTDVKTLLTGYNPIAQSNTEALIYSNRYGKPFLFQSARTMRLGVRFTF